MLPITGANDDEPSGNSVCVEPGALLEMDVVESDNATTLCLLSLTPPTAPPTTIAITAIVIRAMMRKPRRDL